MEKTDALNIAQKYAEILKNNGIDETHKTDRHSYRATPFQRKRI